MTTIKYLPESLAAIVKTTDTYVIKTLERHCVDAANNYEKIGEGQYRIKDRRLIKFVGRRKR